MNNKKTILLCAYDYPPLITPQSIRWFYISRELNKQGYAVDVLTIRMPEKYQELLDEIPEAIKIHRSFPGPFYSLTYKFSGKSSYSNDKVDSKNVSALWKTFTQIHLGVYKALNFFLVPDINCEWLPFAVKKGSRLLSMNSYDIVITSSEPKTCHLVGYYLKKKFGIPWIADYGDSWIYPIPTLAESNLKKKILDRIENRIVKKMDALTVAAKGIKRLYLEKYPFLNSEKIYIMPQAFDPDMFSNVKEETSPVFRIVFCGSFYKNLRDPLAFFEAIKEINEKDIEIVIAGRINEFIHEIKKDGIREKIKYHGFVSHIQSLALQKGASVLLHIGSASDIQVPGKVYEYFGAQRPILCIKSGDKDFSSELIAGYNKGLVVGNKKKYIKEGIKKLYALWKNGSLDENFDLAQVEDFTWQKSAENIINAIEGL